MRPIFILIFLIICLFFATPERVLAFNWAASGNPSNDKLLKMTESEQAAALSKSMRNACEGKEPFYMGTETRPPNANVSFWSLSCSNISGSFMIAIAPDTTGSTRVISCNLLKGEPWTCYEKLKSAK